MSQAKAFESLPNPETVRQIRECLSICLYDIIWAPADDYAAEVMARKLVSGGTTIEDVSLVPYLLRGALAMPVGFLESFDLPHDRERIVGYLEHLIVTLKKCHGAGSGRTR